MAMRALAFGLVALFAGVGCVQAPANEEPVEKPELAPEMKSLVLEAAPTDIPHPLYLDFNGKAELLGYALEPATMAAPGSKVSLKLYWHSTAKLDGDYVPYTELVLPTGKRIEIDGSGPVRKGPLVPGSWEPGKVYIDELEIAVPADIDAARFLIVVGLKTQPITPEEPAEADPKKDQQKADKKPEKATEGTFGTVYLSVLSGPADNKHGGVIASLETGATPGALRARAGKDDKHTGALKRPLKPAKALPAARPAQ